MTAAIGSLAIIGTGIMGRGIAEAALAKGCGVVLIGRSAASLAKAADAIAAAQRLAVRRGQLPAEAADKALSLLRTAADIQQAADCDLIIETVVEDLATKQDVIAQAAAARKPSAILATNTSALRVADIGARLSDRRRFLGLHFMNPAAIVPLVEVVPLAETEPAAVEAAVAFCRDLGKQTVICRDQPGFIVNRLLMILLNESCRLLQEGAASAADIDKAMRLACGHPMGPATLADFIGLDTVCAELRAMAATYGDRYTPAEILQRLVGEGKLGRKTGSGLLAAKTATP
ncbi:MAG: 3-hydroxyacyl-CoA dehydrogenase family protein [Planctomycetota bacterium]|nr:3-hydroxyacyl-CoA dehydrogenase family protein [Planctomycetota bacterium]